MGLQRTLADANLGANSSAADFDQHKKCGEPAAINASSAKTLRRNSAAEIPPVGTPAAAELDENSLEAMEREYLGSWPARFGSDALRRFLTSVLGFAIETIRDASASGRNGAIDSQAFLLGRFGGSDLLRREPALNLVVHSAIKVGLQPEEARERALKHFDDGLSSPISNQELSRMLSGESPLGPQPESDGREVISIEGGCLTSIVDRAEQGLLSATIPQVFQRGDLLVRVSEAEAQDELLSPSGRGPTIYRVDSHNLVERFTQAARWVKFDVRTGINRNIDCPDRVARTYLARRGAWSVPPLRSIIEAPTIRANGTILSEPGYDAQSGNYFAPGSTQFRAIEHRATLDDAIRCLTEVAFMLRGFPWLEDSDRSAALAAILTALVRPSLRTAPLFAFRAPVMGSGKSLLADCVALMATGRTAPVLTQGRDEEEDRKRILSILLDGDSIACIDNVERPLGGAAISSVLTQETYKDRLLGQNQTVTVPTHVTWLATGNNMILHGDITTRVVPCDLDAKCERPEEREFSFDLREHIRRNRGVLVPAALTVLRAFNRADRPSQGLTVFGRFEEWSDTVRSALVWCGEPDPCEGRSRIEDTDPVRSDLGEVLECWSQLFGSRPLTVAEIVKATQQECEFSLRLRTTLGDVAGGSSGVPNARRLGKWLAQVAGRIESGRYVRKNGVSHKVALWQLVSN